MMDFFKKLLEADFMPHGHCYLWQPDILWTHAISDSVIAVAYATIPMSLLFIFKKRKDFKYVWMMVFFAVFILGCGATHVMDVVNIWTPLYRLDGGIRVITALASIGTAIILIKVTPQVLLIPSASEWRRVNKELSHSHEELKRSYEELSKAQLLLQKSNSDLEEKVAARTVELENKNQELKKINYDLDNFVYVASHDLKAPVANLQMLVDMLGVEIQNKDDVQVKELKSFIEKSIEKLDSTIHYLSDITRIQRTLSEDVHEIHFERLLKEVEVSISELIKKAKVKIYTDFQRTSVVFSYTDLQSILYNVISNAVKYRSEERSPLIKISTYEEDAYTVIEVKDNGIGFDISKKDRIYMMFKRLHDHVEGSGIGLYMVKRILENRGGRIEVDSEIGKGTTFKIYIKNLLVSA